MNGVKIGGAMAREVAADLWAVEHPLRVMGAELGRRMTVARLPGGGLWLHSVARLEPELDSWLAARGPVRFVVAPNPMHRRWLERYAAAYPDAELLAEPGLLRHRPDVAFDGVLEDAPDPRWTAVLDQLAVPAGPRFREIVFLHRPSGTLILTDLGFNLPGGRGAWTGLVARALGYHQQLGVSRIVRWLVRDRAALRAAVDGMLAWNFDRVIVGHGEIVETGGKEALRRAFAWL